MMGKGCSSLHYTIGTRLPSGGLVPIGPRLPSGGLVPTGPRLRPRGVLECKPELWEGVLWKGLCWDVFMAYEAITPLFLMPSTTNLG
jgi:hypothetical protein